MQEPELIENPRKNLEILVVDGDPVTRLLHQNRLNKNLSFPITECADGREALDRIRQSPEMDYLVMLAIEMPGMDGWEFLKNLQSTPLKTQVHVIMVTCSVSNSDKKVARRFPQVLDYFEKPLSDMHIHRIPHLPKLIPYFVSVN